MFFRILSLHINKERAKASGLILETLEKIAAYTNKNREINERLINGQDSLTSSSYKLNVEEALKTQTH